MKKPAVPLRSWIALLLVFFGGCGKPRSVVTLKSPTVRLVADKTRFSLKTDREISFRGVIQEGETIWRPDSGILKIFSNPELTHSESSYSLSKQDDAGRLPLNRSVPIPSRTGKYFCQVNIYKYLTQGNYDTATWEKAKGSFCTLPSPVLEIEVVP